MNKADFRKTNTSDSFYNEKSFFELLEDFLLYGSFNALYYRPDFAESICELPTDVQDFMVLMSMLATHWSDRIDGLIGLRHVSEPNRERVLDLWVKTRMTRGDHETVWMYQVVEIAQELGIPMKEQWAKVLSLQTDLADITNSSCAELSSRAKKWLSDRVKN